MAENRRERDKRLIAELKEKLSAVHTWTSERGMEGMACQLTGLREILNKQKEVGQ